MSLAMLIDISATDRDCRIPYIPAVAPMPFSTVALAEHVAVVVVETARNWRLACWNPVWISTILQEEDKNTLLSDCCAW